MPSGEKFAEAYVELRAETDRLKREINQLKGNVKKESRGMGNLFGKGFVTAMAGYITIAGAAALASSIKNMASVGAEVRNVSRAFDRLEDSNDLLLDMKDATRGTVTNLELMRAAIKGIDLGATNEQMKTFTEFARFQAIRQGGDQLRILEDILGGVLRGSTELLDNFGISLTAVNREIETLAKESGTSATKLSAVERRVLMVEAAVRLMNKRMNEFGDTELTDAEKIRRASVAWENFSNKISVLASPVIADGLNAVANELDKILIKVQNFEKTGVSGLNAFMFAALERADDLKNEYGLLGEVIYSKIPDILKYDKQTRAQMEFAKTIMGSGMADSTKGADDAEFTKTETVSVVREFRSIKKTDNLDTLKQRSGEALRGTAQAADLVYEEYNRMYENISDVSEYALEGLMEQGAEAAGTLQREFESFFFELTDWNESFIDNVTQGFQSMAQSFIMEVNRMIAKWLAFQTLKLVAGAVFGPAGSDFVEKAFGHEGGEFMGTSVGVRQVGAYAQGGSFIVPPGYQNDTYPLFVESREKVRVTPANQVGEDVRLLGRVVEGIQAMNANIASRLGGVERVVVDGELQGRNLQLAVERSQRLEGRYRG